MKKFLSIFLAVVTLLSCAVSFAAAESTDAKTSAENRVYSEGEFDYTTLETPVLLTSFGQSADVSMLNALFKKLDEEVDYTFEPLATAEEVAQYKTVIIAAGMSSKGLGAAGISEESEFSRAEEIINTVKENDITVIFAHLGGSARRGAKSDQFADMVLGISSYLIFVEEGDLSDHKFSNYAINNNLPYTAIFTIVDALEPLNEMF
ncbi:MAG TPA: hypothetical protein IAC36_04610 [Candidatus Aphodomonas merdavium]|nr:hypothetical protein [Candidatus Aphodomonas merdavium]